VSRWLALVEAPAEEPPDAFDASTKGDETQPRGEKDDFCLLMSNRRRQAENKNGGSKGYESGSIKVSPIGSEQLRPTRPVDGPHRHGTTFDGTPKTWTGKIISLDQWRRLSEWEKHGPNGKHWNGETQSWEMPE
jgi:hypothetical protein